VTISSRYQHSFRTIAPQPNLTVIQRLTDQGEELSTASIVYHEMLFVGASESRRQQRHRIGKEEVETKLIILPYDAEAANWHAAERAGLVGTGEPPLSRWANCGDRRQ